MRRKIFWLPPERPLSAENRATAIAYLDRQGRIDLAVWVAYRFRPEGVVDHELVLRLRGRRPGASQLQALFYGVDGEMGLFGAYVGFPTHAEMAQARRVGDVVWKRRGHGPADADLLDFRFALEGVELSGDVRAAIRRLAATFPELRRVRLQRSTLLKSSDVVRDGVIAFLEIDSEPGPGAQHVSAFSELLRPYFRKLSVSLVGVSSRISGSTIAYSRRAKAART